MGTPPKKHPRFHTEIWDGLNTGECGKAVSREKNTEEWNKNVVLKKTRSKTMACVENMKDNTNRIFQNYPCNILKKYLDKRQQIKRMKQKNGFCFLKMLYFRRKKHNSGTEISQGKIKKA